MREYYQRFKFFMFNIFLKIRLGYFDYKEPKFREFSIPVGTETRDDLKGIQYIINN